MSTILLLNEDVSPGFYGSVAEGRPRFLVMPNEDGSLDAIQLDACPERRAFTVFKLGSRGVALGRWLGDMAIKIDCNEEESALSASESPIGSAVISEIGLVFQFLNADGSIRMTICPVGKRLRAHAREQSGCARRWKITIRHNDHEEVVFESHPQRHQTAS